MRVGFRDLRQQGTICNDNEFPRLLIASRGSRHCCSEDLFDLLLGYGTTPIRTDAAAVDNFLHRYKIPSPESKTAYARLVAESRRPVLRPPKDEQSVSVAELAAAFLEHTRTTLETANYTHHRIVIADFLLKLYGTDTSADDFRPSCLKLVRQDMVESKRLCRSMVNDYTRRITRMFTWGVEEEYVNPNTALALKAVKALPSGAPGTFENEPREPVPDEVIRRTLPFMPNTLQALVKLQRLTGCRPSEVFKMRVGEIDTTTDPDLWVVWMRGMNTWKSSVSMWNRQ